MVGGPRDGRVSMAPRFPLGKSYNHGDFFISIIFIAETGQEFIQRRLAFAGPWSQGRGFGLSPT
jgi:hypothetical protein